MAPKKPGGSLSWGTLITVVGLTFSFSTGVVAGMAYIFTTFATIRYVDERFNSAIEHSDRNRQITEEKLSSALSILTRIEAVVLRLDLKR